MGVVFAVGVSSAVTVGVGVATGVNSGRGNVVVIGNVGVGSGEMSVGVSGSWAVTPPAGAAATAATPSRPADKFTSPGGGDKYNGNPREKHSASQQQGQGLTGQSKRRHRFHLQKRRLGKFG